jgi:hypothetical protein
VIISVSVIVWFSLDLGVHRSDRLELGSGVPGLSHASSNAMDYAVAAQYHVREFRLDFVFEFLQPVGGSVESVFANRFTVPTD